MDLVAIVVGAIVVVFGIIKTISDDKKQSVETPHLPRTKEISYQNSMPLPQVDQTIVESKNSDSGKLSKLDARTEGVSSLSHSADDSENLTPEPARRCRRHSALRAAFINTEILNRKF